jgi:hypothetical protein
MLVGHFSAGKFRGASCLNSPRLAEAAAHGDILTQVGLRRTAVRDKPRSDFL